jgi:hypothetical protein
MPRLLNQRNYPVVQGSEHDPAYTCLNQQAGRYGKLAFGYIKPRTAE